MREYVVRAYGLSGELVLDSYPTYRGPAMQAATEASRRAETACVLVLGLDAAGAEAGEALYIDGDSVWTNWQTAGDW